MADEDRTRLIKAARRGDEDGVVDVLGRTPQLATDWKPLLDACYGGHEAVVGHLIAAGADPNVVSHSAPRYRPLHRAVEWKRTAPRGPGHIAVVERLLAAGADATARGGHESLTPLGVMAIGGQTQFEVFLAPPLEPLDIFHAAALGRSDRVDELIRLDSTVGTAQDANGWTPLMYASASRVHHDHADRSADLLSVAELLVHAGADPNANWMWGGNWPVRPLYWATGHADHPALARFLLSRGADPNDGESLYHSAEHHYEECLTLLTDAGADLNFNEEPWSHTPLHFVVSLGATRGARWLLSRGADPNALSTARRETSLHAAARRGLSISFLEALLKHGADPAALDAEGMTAADVARNRSKDEAARYLDLATGPWDSWKLPSPGEPTPPPLQD